jgi:flavin-binding protein dodecin
LRNRLSSGDEFLPRLCAAKASMLGANHMDRTYKKIEIVGVSETSFGEATQNAVAKACQSLRHVDWFEVTEMRGLVENAKVKEFQVTVKIGFRLEDQPA